MSIVPMSISIPTIPQSLSSAKAISGGLIPTQSLSLITRPSHLSLSIPGTIPFKTTPIHMGGGPRTYPGGVSKWQWKRMQAKKAKQLLKARLARERQIYEMRKRAELKAAVSELERPWETVEKPPNLFSVGADEQLKVLADRFQKPGGFDLWSERDGPELFRPDNGLPSARFFPKGVVHSIKPYGKTENFSSGCEEFGNSDSEEDLSSGSMFENDGGKAREANSGGLVSRSLKSIPNDGEDGNFYKGRQRKKGSRRNGNSDAIKTGTVGLHRISDGGRNRRLDDTAGKFRERSTYVKGRNKNSEVFDMSLQNDGSYGFELEK